MAATQGARFVAGHMLATQGSECAAAAYQRPARTRAARTRPTISFIILHLQTACRSPGAARGRRSTGSSHERKERPGPHGAAPSARWSTFCPARVSPTSCVLHQRANSRLSQQRRATSSAKAGSPAQRSCAARNCVTMRRAIAAHSAPKSGRAAGSVSTKSRMLRSSSLKVLIVELHDPEDEGCADTEQQHTVVGL